MAVPQLEEQVAALPAPQMVEPSAQTLLGGLIKDLESLLRQEIALLRQEALEDLDDLKSALLAQVPIALLFILGALLLVLALAQGIAAILDWPVWAGYAVLGVILSLASLLLIVIRRPNPKKQ